MNNFINDSRICYSYLTYSLTKQMIILFYLYKKLDIFSTEASVSFLVTKRNSCCCALVALLLLPLFFFVINYCNNFLLQHFLLLFPDVIASLMLCRCCYVEDAVIFYGVVVFYAMRSRTVKVPVHVKNTVN